MLAKFGKKRILLPKGGAPREKRVIGQEKLK